MSELFPEPLLLRDIAEKNADTFFAGKDPLFIPLLVSLAVMLKPQRDALFHRPPESVFQGSGKHIREAGPVVFAYPEIGNHLSHPAIAVEKRPVASHRHHAIGGSFQLHL